MCVFLNINGWNYRVKKNMLGSSVVDWCFTTFIKLYKVIELRSGNLIIDSTRKEDHIFPETLVVLKQFI